MDTDTTRPDTAAPIAAVVYNPVNVPVQTLRAAVTLAEREHGWRSSHWFPTSSEDGGGAAARAAIATTPTVVLAAGGDGTVRAVAEQLYPTGIPLALLPSGTGNLLARNLHLTLDDLPRAVETAFTGTPRNVDIAFAEYRTGDGTLHRHAFVVMAGIGLDAHMAANTNQKLKKRIGWAAYADPIARSVFAGKPIRLHYRVDGGHTRALSAHTVIVGNCGTLTANILLLPDAVVDDGLLDVVAFRPKSPIGWAGIGSQLATNRLLARNPTGNRLLGRTLRSRALRYLQASRFEARFDTPQHLQLDGDAMGVATAVRLTVLHKGLVLRLPHSG